jgi:hypothetical protein
VGDAVTTSIVGIVSGLVSGGGVALLNHFLSRNRTQAEIQKVQAEAEKTRAETSKILAEVKSVSAAVSYSLGSIAEEILFQGTPQVDGFDVQGEEGNLWTADGKPIGGKGLGELKFEDGGVLNVHRGNTEGRFELRFQRYTYRGKEHTFIPKDELISGKRKLRVSGESKAVGGTHRLRFVVKVANSSTTLVDASVRVESNEWTNFAVFLPADPSQDCMLRIYDQEVSSAPSSIQIRNVVVAQRNSQPTP